METQIEKQLGEVTRRIVVELNPKQIILFGSHAYGHPTSESDVDLLIVMESEERPARRAALVSRLLRPRPFAMDIIVRTPFEIQHRLRIGDQFIQDVMSRGKVLYER
ncbi:MAG: nucleotidyltransferase domain-containing protein [Chloroflexi bacterium]|nr:nucleotidyltransferase domain-containing protein [Chloroflexota bacterium]